MYLELNFVVLKVLNARKYFSRERNLHQTGTINGLSLSRVLDIKSGKSDVLGTKWSGSLSSTWYLIPVRRKSV